MMVVVVGYFVNLKICINGLLLGDSDVYGIMFIMIINVLI